MKKRILIIATVIFLMLAAGIIFLFTYVPPLSENHGKLSYRLYLQEADSIVRKYPLVVVFGGAEGGNDWTRDYMKEKRDSLMTQGFAIMSVAYFRADGIPESLDRISLNAIADTVLKVAQHPKIDETRIALMGGSRGGELVLNLASRYPQFKAVVAMSTSNVSFPALTWSANTSSWTYNGEEVSYVPATLETISPALEGDLFAAHSIMLKDKEAVKRAEIAVENINGAVLIMSGKNDDQWPATDMSEQMMMRFENHNFAYPFEHLVLNGGHTAPLDHFNKVYAFLDENLQ